jgi:hypothetical protein
MDELENIERDLYSIQNRLEIEARADNTLPNVPVIKACEQAIENARHAILDVIQQDEFRRGSIFK